MNINRLAPREVERLFASKLRTLLAQVFPAEAINVTEIREADQRIDLIASVETPKGPRLDFLVECKTNARPSQIDQAPDGEEYSDMPAVGIRKDFNSATHKLERVHCWVFAAPFVSPRLAEVCWGRGWGWFDLAGNCRISIPGLFYIDRKGNEPVHRLSRPNANLGTPEAAQVIRALLKPEHSVVNWASQRILQQEVKPGVSLGLVNKIVSHLRSEGHLVGEPNGGFHVADKSKLLATWRDVYRFDRIPKVEWFTLLKGPDIEQALRRINGKTDTRIVWAAFSAAERQAPMVRQSKYWLMASDDHIDWAVDELKAKPVETGANLVLLTAPDLGYLDGAKDEDNAGLCTHPLQTYVDTWHAGGRGPEAAEAVLERRLQPAWHKATFP